jgi:RNase H-like domain found in reverse transcriptase
MLCDTPLGLSQADKHLPQHQGPLAYTELCAMADEETMMSQQGSSAVSGGVLITDEEFTTALTFRGAHGQTEEIAEHCLIDTGAKRGCISLPLFHDLLAAGAVTMQDRFELETPRLLRSYDQSVTPTEITHGITLRVQSAQHSHFSCILSFLLVPSLTHPCILGRDLLNKYHTEASSTRERGFKFTFDERAEEEEGLTFHQGNTTGHALNHTLSAETRALLQEATSAAHQASTLNTHPRSPRPPAPVTSPSPSNCRPKALNLFSGAGGLCQAFKKSVHTVLAVCAGNLEQRIFNDNHDAPCEIADLTDLSTLTHICNKAATLQVQVLLASIPRRTEVNGIYQSQDESSSLWMVAQALTRIPTLCSVLLDVPEGFTHTDSCRRFINVLRSMNMHAHSQVLSSTHSDAPLDCHQGILLFTRQQCTGGVRAIRDTLSTFSSLLAENRQKQLTTLRSSLGQLLNAPAGGRRHCDFYMLPYTRAGQQRVFSMQEMPPSHNADPSPTYPLTWPEVVRAHMFPISYQWLPPLWYDTGDHLKLLTNSILPALGEFVCALMSAAGYWEMLRGSSPVLTPQYSCPQPFAKSLSGTSPEEFHQQLTHTDNLNTMHETHHNKNTNPPVTCTNCKNTNHTWSKCTLPYNETNHRNAARTGTPHARSLTHFRRFQAHVMKKYPQTPTNMPKPHITPFHFSLFHYDVGSPGQARAAASRHGPAESSSRLTAANIVNVAVIQEVAASGVPHTGEHETLHPESPPHEPNNTGEDGAHSLLQQLLPPHLLQLNVHYNGLNRLMSNILGFVMRLGERAFDTCTAPPLTPPACFNIALKTNSQPISQKPIRYSEALTKILKTEILGLENEGAIRPSSSDWASPVVAIRRTDGTIRLTANYAMLNDHTELHPPPPPDEGTDLERMMQSHVFSTTQISEKLNHLPCNANTTPLTAMITTFGLYEWLRCPPGLVGTHTHAIMTTRSALSTLPQVCFDGNRLIIHSPNLMRHIHDWNEVLQALQEHGLQISTAQTNFNCPSANYNGRLISHQKNNPNPEKVSAIACMPVPTNLPNLRSWIGTAQYYRKFITNFADTMQPLMHMMNKDATFALDEQQTSIISSINHTLATHALHRFPDYHAAADGSRPLIVATDACKHGLGAVLSQEDEDGTEQPIAFASRCTMPHEKNWGTTHTEAAGIYYGVKHFRNMLGNLPFVIFTDHRALQWLESCRDKSAKLAGWAEYLSNFQYVIKYRPGKREPTLMACHATPCPPQHKT